MDTVRWVFDLRFAEYRVNLFSSGDAALVELCVWLFFL